MFFANFPQSPRPINGSMLAAHTSSLGMHSLGSKDLCTEDKAIIATYLYARSACSESKVVKVCCFPHVDMVYNLHI